MSLVWTVQRTSSTSMDRPYLLLRSRPQTQDSQWTSSIFVEGGSLPDLTTVIPTFQTILLLVLLFMLFLFFLFLVLLFSLSIRGVNTLLVNGQEYCKNGMGLNPVSNHGFWIVDITKRRSYKQIPATCVFLVLILGNYRSFREIMGLDFGFFPIQHLVPSRTLRVLSLRKDTGDYLEVNDPSSYS